MRAFDKKKGENPSANTFFSPKIQTKLQTGTPGDRYEVEADKVADKVVNKPKGSLLQSKSEEIQQKPLAENISMVQKQDMKEEETVQKKTEEKEETVQKKEEEKETVQAKCKDCEDEGKVQKKSNDEEKPVQSKSDASQPKTSTSSLETNLSRSKGSGQKMEKSTQHEMEAGFGSDFSNVTIHTDSNAVQMSEELGAHAFTHGNDVYFNNGKYNPNTKEGKHLLAHELTHTVQQKGKTENNLQKKVINKFDRPLLKKNVPTGTTFLWEIPKWRTNSLESKKFDVVNGGTIKVFPELEWAGKESCKEISPMIHVAIYKDVIGFDDNIHNALILLKGDQTITKKLDEGTYYVKIYLQHDNDKPRLCSMKGDIRISTTFR